jgi:hypothetical protein
MKVNSVMEVLLDVNETTRILMDAVEEESKIYLAGTRMKVKNRDGGVTIFPDGSAKVRMMMEDEGDRK